MNFEIKNKYSVVQMDEHGNIISWKFNETDDPGREVDLFFPRQIINIDGGEKVRGGSHFCYPIFGNDPKKEIARHGFLRELEVSVATEGEESQIDFEFRHNSDLEKRYANLPLPKLRRKLDSEGYELFEELVIDTTDGFDDYFNVGLHPYFQTPTGEFNLEIEDKNSTRRKITNYMIETNKSIFLHTKIPEFKIHCRNLGSFKWTLQYDSFLPITVSGIYIWRDSNKYVCIEPVYRENNIIFDKGKNIRTFQSSMRFTPA